MAVEPQKMNHRLAWIHRAIVAPSNSVTPFPIQMLLIDSCTPESAIDAVALQDALIYSQESRPMALLQPNNKDPEWSLGKWKDFGWTLIEVSVADLEDRRQDMSTGRWKTWPEIRGLRIFNGLGETA